MKLILKFLKPRWKLCLITFLLISIEMIGALLVPTFAGEMLNKGASNDSTFNELVITTIKMLVVTIIAGISSIIGGYTSAKLSSSVGADIRKAIYKKTLDLSVYDFQTFGTASMTTRMTSDISSIQMAIVNIFQMILPVPIIFIVSLGFSFSKDWMIGLILLAVLVSISIFALFILKGASPLFKKLQKLLDKMSNILLENITGVRVIRAFNNEEFEKNRLNESFNDYKVTSVKANRLFASLDALSYFAVNLFVVLIYWISGSRIYIGQFNFGDITSVIEYALLSLFFLMMAQMVILTLPRAFECSNRINEVLEFFPEIKNKDDKIKNLDENEDILKFENVSFKYNDADEYTLENLNFSCKKGTTTAIIGGTGSGKSTIASLMLRFNEVTNGSIKLNGVDIRDLTQEQLRDNLSYVQQKAWLFSGTIADNLRFGNKNATDEELMRALDIAQVGDFVRSLPDKLNSYVAQGGTNFSGGQKQRLSIARAIVKNPQLYIFDDSFSALDFKTDANLRKALKKEKGDKAMVIIAQRVSTIKNADQIIVIDKGIPVGKGKHEELLKSCKTYKEIYESQTKEAN